MRRRGVAIACPAALLAALAMTLAAGAQTGPPRDAVARAESSTGIIRGRVVAHDDGQPLRRALIRATAPGMPMARVTMTDAEGHFQLRELAPGRYTVEASKGGYVTLQHGQRLPFGTVRPIELAGAPVHDITFRLPRGGVITGRVLDEAGDPVIGVQVQTLRATFVTQDVSLTPLVSLVPVHGGLGIRTDDRGAFRLFGLPAGDYYVSATPLPLTGARDAGEMLGPNYLPTYFPGTLTPSSAQLVTVASGAETAIAIPLVRARMARLSGIVVDATGRPAEQVQLSLQEFTAGGIRNRNLAVAAGGGTWDASQVVPGEYMLVARTFVDAAAPGFAVLPVTVAGDALDGLTLALSPPVSVRGRIVGPGGTVPTGLRPSDVTVRTVAASYRQIAGPRHARATPDSTWRFQLTGVLGTVALRLDLPAAWTVKAISRHGVDIIDAALDFRQGDVDDVVIELTQSLTSLEGAVQDSRGAALREYVVVAFTDDPARWTPASRHVQAARPDAAGRFRIRGLPAGQYLVAALHDLAPGDDSNPVLLDRLRRLGAVTRIDLREGEPHELVLTVADTL